MYYLLYKLIGHFTQMVWVNTKYFGVGKATSNTGKIFVVAYYYPPGKTLINRDVRTTFNNFLIQGNIVNAFHENVLLPPMDDPQSPKDLNDNGITAILKS